MTEFWETRMQGEPETAYQAFCVYRDMGITRSLRKAAAAFYDVRGGDGEGPQRDPKGTPNPAALRRFKAWSSKFLWQARVEAFDAAEAHERSKKMQQRRQQMLESHFSIAQLVLKRLVDTLQSYEPHDMIPASQFAPLLTAATNLQRLSVGERPDQDHQQTTTTTRAPDDPLMDQRIVEHMSLEDREELARLGYVMDGIEAELRREDEKNKPA